MYKSLSKKLQRQIEEDRKINAVNPYAFKDKNALRRDDKAHDRATILRSPFIRDCDKIINCPFFARYQDKTQVFSLYKNDDITRRSLHIQFVSRIARTLGKALNLNLELIEAIALGHDIGHTPFGHAGEHILNEIFFERTGKRFFHNVQSVRVLDKIFNYNLTLQTLDGILCHNGERELPTYQPQQLSNFTEFDNLVNCCYTGSVTDFLPSTLEGCVVRVADIIAYIGKDRKDAEIMGDAPTFTDDGIGTFNAEMINNLTVDIVENSYNKPYIKMSNDTFDALKKAKAENYKKIYFSDKVNNAIASNLKPMMERLYDRLFDDIKKQDKNSYIFLHHIDYIKRSHYKRESPYEKENPHFIVVDYISAMTDDYFIDLYQKLFTDKKYSLKYIGYFD